MCQFHVCHDGTVVDLAKVIAVRPVTTIHRFADASFTYEVVFDHGRVHIGENNGENVKACRSALIKALGEFARSRGDVSVKTA